MILAIITPGISSYVGPSFTNWALPLPTAFTEYKVRGKFDGINKTTNKENTKHK